MTIRLSRAIFDALRAHAEAAYPEECCGALLGRLDAGAWQVAEAMPVENAAKAGAQSRRYEFGGRDLVGIAIEARRQNLEVAGFYHSHPDCAAEWSATDLDGAHWIGASYLIVEVRDGRATAIRSFRLAGNTEEDKRFEAEAVEVMEDRRAPALQTKDRP